MHSGAAMPAIPRAGVGAPLDALVSAAGYLHNPSQEIVGSAGADTAHAWAEVYVPGAGWITFDPTNLSVGGANLVPIAVGHDIRQVIPVTGEFVGMSGAFDAMSVEISIRA